MTGCKTYVCQRGGVASGEASGCRCGAQPLFKSQKLRISVDRLTLSLTLFRSFSDRFFGLALDLLIRIVRLPGSSSYSA
ncbi:hypothetical protein EMWEY_00051730 [Eimeria maxima]|uniref:Uncharacterized protein n=1 Tax=Eimeria maxima TaxID=5804 RepID=U6M680_EIMMA|nr:hypothetical protein EMWEY_00051730 [Eimeria maxima]CDJ58553.1 hypothetical protein EMWEY_00051730 [Eimeria maxima]